jgi:hypothetical protein
MPTTLIRRTARLRDMGLGRGTRIIRRGGTDIIVNGGFETDLGFWIDQGTDATVTRTQSNEQAHSGTFSQKVVTDGSEPFQGAIHVLLSWQAGQSLDGRFWIHGAAGDGVRVVFFNTNTAGVAAVDTFTLDVTGWQELQLQGTAIDSPVETGYFIVDTGATPQAVTWYLDDVRLVVR